MIGSVLSAVSSVFGAIKLVMKWLGDRALRKAGRNEARLEAYEREAERAHDRREIDKDVRDLDPDDLERELHNR